MDIISIPLTDQLKPIPDLRTRTFFILNDRLDEEKLKNALDTLVRHHWRKLGARLVTRPKDGLLEYHLPRKFEEKYMLFNWSSQEYDHSIDKIPSFPKATPPENGLALLPHLQSVESWLRPADWPLNRITEPPNVPLLYVHISLFADATSVGVSCPHVVVDQFGLANIIRAWLGLVKGDTPPPMIGFEDDIFGDEKPYADYTKKEVVRKGKMRVRRRMEYPFILMGFIPELIMHSKEDSYTLFLPLSLVQSLRERHSKTVTEKYGADPGITNGDIISAILLKFGRIHHKSSRVVSFTQSVNLRGRIPKLDGDRNAFIHNALHYSTSRFPVDPSTPVSEIAYQNRKAIIESLDEKDISTNIAVVHEMVRRRQPVHVCELFERSFFVTNWTAAWKGLDFSPAIKEPEHVANGISNLKLFILGESKVVGGPDRFSPSILCKTNEGYFSNFSVPRKASKLIEEYLKKDPMLENL